MAAVIDGPPEARAEPFVLLSPGGGGRPLFIVHSLWGDVLPLRPLALALGTDRPVYGLQARGLNPGLTPQNRVEEMAATYLETVRSIQPAGPYAIAGYSFGGLVAFEMARVLRERGEAIDWLGLIDPGVDHGCLSPPRRWRFLAERALRRLRVRIAARTRLARYRRHGVPLWARLEPTAPTLTPLLRALRAANRQAFAAYRPGPYDGSATFVAAAIPAIGEDLCDPLPVWRRVVRGGLTVENVPGRHDDILSAEQVRFVADAIAPHLR
jgi:acetoacetyl-CoA synthetase